MSTDEKYEDHLRSKNERLELENKQLKKDLELSLDKFQVNADKYLNLKQKLEKMKEYLIKFHSDDDSIWNKILNSQ